MAAGLRGHASLGTVVSHDDEPSALRHGSTATLSAGTVSNNLLPDSDLPQRPLTTSPPGLPIEGTLAW